MIFISVLIIAFLASLAGFGFSRISLPRKPGFEGIEDKDAAAAYDRINAWPQFRLIRRTIVNRLSMYSPSGTIADIGCGPGRLITLIARKFPELKIIGIDTANEMIETAKREAAASGISGRTEFRIGDAGQLPLEDNSIDFAVSTFSLHHWSDPVPGLSEIYRVLKPGGQLLLFDFRRDSRRFFYWLLRFAQTVAAPSALRSIGEPLGSLLASYSVFELIDIFGQTQFKDWKFTGGIALVYAWAKKE